LSALIQTRLTLDQKTQDELKPQPPYLITKDSIEIAKYHEQSFVPKAASDIIFVSSFWSFPVKFNVAFGKITFNTGQKIILGNAEGIIGKDVIIRWPGAQNYYW
jgi:hypothetical protein